MKQSLQSLTPVQPLILHCKRLMFNIFPIMVALDRHLTAYHQIWQFFPKFDRYCMGGSETKDYQAVRLVAVSEFASFIPHIEHDPHT